MPVFQSVILTEQKRRRKEANWYKSLKSLPFPLANTESPNRRHFDIETKDNSKCRMMNVNDCYTPEYKFLRGTMLLCRGVSELICYEEYLSLLTRFLNLSTNSKGDFILEISGRFSAVAKRKLGNNAIHQKSVLLYLLEQPKY